MAGPHKHQKEIAARALNYQSTAEGRTKKNVENDVFGEKTT